MRLNFILNDLKNINFSIFLEKNGISKFLYNNIQCTVHKWALRNNMPASVTLT